MMDQTQHSNFSATNNYPPHQWPQMQASQQLYSQMPSNVQPGGLVASHHNQVSSSGASINPQQPHQQQQQQQQGQYYYPQQPQQQAAQLTKPITNNFQPPVPQQNYSNDQQQQQQSTNNGDVLTNQMSHLSIQPQQQKQQQNDQNLARLDAVLPPMKYVDHSNTSIPQQPQPHYNNRLNDFNKMPPATQTVPSNLGPSPPSIQQHQVPPTSAANYGVPPVSNYNFYQPNNYSGQQQQGALSQNEPNNSWKAPPQQQPQFPPSSVVQQQQKQQYPPSSQQSNGYPSPYGEMQAPFSQPPNLPPGPPSSAGPGYYNQSYGTQPVPNRYGAGGATQPVPQAPFSPGASFQQQQQQNKLDPDAMPSVVQVILEDKEKYMSNNNVIFSTTIPASVPPLVSTILENDNQVVDDGGSARPLFVQSTIYQVPTTEDMLKTLDIPFGLLIKPFDDQEVEGKIYVPVTNSEIVRCNRCKAYMNPYNRFIDGGNRFQCALCHHITEVTPSYFANLDHTGQRLDKIQRPELYLGSYEFRATEEYCRNSIMNNRRPHLIFACELTETSKPILSILSANLVNIIKNFPKDPLNPQSMPPMFGFVTYNSTIQLYDIINNGHAHVVCDVSTPFPPLNSFLVDPLIHMDKIESFLQTLPKLWENDELEMQPILGPVIEAALMATQVDVTNWLNHQGPPAKLVANNNNGSEPTQTYETIPVGKVYMFHCTLPSYGSDGETPGRLKQRWTNSIDEIRKLMGTDKEKTILSPDSNKYYVELGQKCVADFGTGIELFLFPPANGSYLDVATLGELTRLTGTGAIYRYFNDFSDTFLTDLRYSLYSSFAFDCVLKVRTSTGIRPNDYVGFFYSRSPSDVECSAINTSTNLLVEFKYDEKLPEDEHVVIQTAILYTALSGERRVRLHNIALATCQQVGDVYRNASCDMVVNFISRTAVNHLRKGDKTIQQIKEIIINRVINILVSYRKHCAQPGTSLGQLILPEALKILPMYICGLLKCDAIDGGPEVSPDDKAHAQLKLLGAYTSLSQIFLYPRLYKIEYEESEAENVLKSSQIRCSSHKLTASALAYVLENGFYVLIFLTTNGCNNAKFLNSLFGPNVDSATKIPTDSGLPNLLTNESQFMTRLIKQMEYQRKQSYKIFIIRQGLDKVESVFRSFLYEDTKIQTRDIGESKLEGLSYVDLLCHLHKEIRSQLKSYM